MPSPTVLPNIDTSSREEMAKLYHVVLLDDDEHTYDYVVEMLVKLFFFGESDAFQHAVEVDTSGRTIVMTCELTQAEYARDQIHSYGKDWRMPKCKGSMSAILEPATAPSHA
jgi:ATP-dependent Clp protease adaptor protein ClpS